MRQVEDNMEAGRISIAGIDVAKAHLDVGLYGTVPVRRSTTAGRALCELLQ